MKKLSMLLFAFVLLLVAPVYADKPLQVDSQGLEVAWQQSNCTNIQSGELTDSSGQPLVMGYDEFGYNYQAHMFNGTYDSSDRVLDGKYWGASVDYADDKLMMKWSDEWLANVDCNGDKKLDRGLVNGVVGGTSLGWTTNHVEGEYLVDENEQHYTYFLKMVWVGPGGSLWGQYDVIQENYQDPTYMIHEHYAAPGLGLNA